MTAGNLQELAARITEPLRTTAGREFVEIIAPMLALLARGNSASVSELAAATGKTPEALRAALAQLPSVEWDEQGRIVGAGLSLRPTPHHFELDGRTLYTWCAFDALTLAAGFDAPARIASQCRMSGKPVTISVTPAGIETVEPASAVLTVVAPQDLVSIRSVVCANSHFFISPEAASQWLGNRPAAAILPIPDGYRLGRLITEAFVPYLATEA